MKVYYRLLPLLLTLTACHAPQGWSPESLRGESVASTSTAGWHLFVHLDDETRALLNLFPRSSSLPPGIRSLHLAGRRSTIQIVEGEGRLPSFFYRLLFKPDGWQTFPSGHSWGISHGDEPVVNLDLPPVRWDERDALKDSPALFMRMRVKGKGWLGTAHLSHNGSRWTLVSRFPVTDGISQRPAAGDAPLTLASGRGSPTMGWILGRRAPAIEVAVIPRGATIRVDKHLVTIGGGAESAVGKADGDDDATLIMRYDRSRFRYPEGLKVPFWARRLMSGVDSLEIMCKNRDSLEVCRGIFTLKE